MARGLSEIQKKLIILAYKNGIDLSYSQALHDLWWWSYSYRYGSKREASMVIGAKNFNMFVFGIDQYRSARVVLSKSISRLESRGLIKKVTHRLVLTDAGIKKAQELLANTG
jgi:hypothetical protein